MDPSYGKDGQADHARKPWICFDIRSIVTIEVCGVVVT